MARESSNGRSRILWGDTRRKARSRRYNASEWPENSIDRHEAYQTNRLWRLRGPFQRTLVCEVLADEREDRIRRSESKSKIRTLWKQRKATVKARRAMLSIFDCRGASASITNVMSSTLPIQLKACSASAARTLSNPASQSSLVPALGTAQSVRRA
jgi:hypothetical protein